MVKGIKKILRSAAGTRRRQDMIRNSIVPLTRMKTVTDGLPVTLGARRLLPIVLNGLCHHSY